MIRSATGASTTFSRGVINARAPTSRALRKGVAFVQGAPTPTVYHCELPCSQVEETPEVTLSPSFATGHVSGLSVKKNRFPSVMTRGIHSAPQEPDFGVYKSKNSVETNKTYAYLTIGALGMLSVVGARTSVARLLDTMNPAKDVLALSSCEVDLAGIPEGAGITIKWRGKPVFVRHRTAGEIAEARAVDVSSLPDPQTDEERVQIDKWLVVMGVCTHLGCVPVNGQGAFGGYFCPCHGSHYDISGRIRLGPAPLNLEVPDYAFLDDNTIKIG